MEKDNSARTPRDAPQSDILPCPFCGGEDAYTRLVGAGYQIVCNGCKVHTQAASNNDAIAAWNRRAALDQIVMDWLGARADWDTDVGEAARVILRKFMATSKSDVAREMEKAMGPDHSREGVFVYHNCWKCDDGKKPCPKGNPRNCENLHARDD